MSELQIITPRYKKWLVENPESAYPEHVASWVRDQLMLAGRDRRGGFSPSNVGCPRAQELLVLGAPSTDVIPSALQNLFNDGKWRHLRWQAVLLSAGILDSAEVKLLWPAMRMQGSADGVLTVPDDHPNEKWRGKEAGFELKGMNTFAWTKRKELLDEGAPVKEILKEEHVAQCARYALLSGWDLFVVIYESKSTQEWFEVVLEITPEMLDREKAEIIQMNLDIDQQKLAEKLPECAQLKGAFKECGYGKDVMGACFRAKDWPTERILRSWRD